MSLRGDIAGATLAHMTAWLRCFRIVMFGLLYISAVGSGAVAQAPDWQVNPAGFESNMSVAAVVLVDGVETTGPTDVVAAFSGEEVRGVAGPVDSGSGLRFFLTIYADAAGEEITFKVYLDSQDRELDLTETITFAANGIVGNVSDPFVLSTTTLGSCTRGRPVWSVNQPDFESNMSVTARVAHDGVLSGDPGDLLAALVGSEIRGVTSPTATPSGQAYFLTVYSNTSGESVSFATYDAVKDLVMPVAESLTFVPNDVHGNPTAPFAITAACTLTSTHADSPDAFLGGDVSVYPNPFRDRTTIEVDLERPGTVVVELVDLLGRRVWSNDTGHLLAGTHRFTVDRGGLASGVYLYRVTQGPGSRHGTVAVVTQ